MYIFKTVEIPHKMWSGKPTENLETVLNHHGKDSWRLSTMGTEVRGAKVYTVLILEKEVAEDYYETHELKPLPPEYDADDFV